MEERIGLEPLDMLLHIRGAKPLKYGLFLEGGEGPMRVQVHIELNTNLDCLRMSAMGGKLTLSAGVP